MINHQYPHHSCDILCIISKACDIPILSYLIVFIGERYGALQTYGWWLVIAFIGEMVCTLQAYGWKLVIVFIGERDGRYMHMGGGY